MSRIRVLDLAKELGLDTKTTIVKLQEIGVVVKNHFNAVSDTEAEKLRGFLKTGKTIDKDGAKPTAKVLIRRRTVESTREGEGSETPGEHVSSSSDSSGLESVAEAPAFAQKEKEHIELELAVVSPEVVAAPPSVEAPQLREVPEAAPHARPSDEVREAVKSFSPSEVSAVAAAEPNRSDVGESKVSSQESKTETSSTPNAEFAPQRVTEASHTEALGSFEQQVQPAAGSEPSLDALEAPQPPLAEQAPVRPAATSATIVQRAQPVEAPRPPQPASQGVQAQARPAGAGGANFSAVVVRRGAAEEQQSSSGATSAAGRTYTRPSTGGGGLVSGERRQGWSQTEGGVARTSTGGFQTAPGGGYTAGGRPPEPRTPRGPGEGSSGGFDRAGGGANRGGGARPSSFVTPDTPLGKDSPLRTRADKDRDRDKVRRSTIEEENARRAASARVKGRHETDEFEPDDYVQVEGGEDAPQAEVRRVYTPLPNRRRGSTGARKKEIRRMEAPNPTKASKKIIRVDENIKVGDLAGELSIKASAVIKALMQFGVMAGVNQVLDFDTATLVAQEFGFETQNTTVSIGDILSRKTSDMSEIPEMDRPPVVTIMGHVDHGKTSLLDAIRATDVAAGEAGGITQHIGAYQVELNGRRITFLDTPGHEAFTQMRARGAQVTDLVVLVVAADDGVMPQTVEAINHAKAANVPIVVAINKIDKQGINLDRIMRELADHGVMQEDWGGDSMFVKVSAKTKEGLTDLLESIILQADVLDLKARRDVNAAGVVIEAKLDKARGPVATVIVTQGVLRPQDSVVAGTACGRVRAIFSDKGERMLEAGPAQPVEILGFDQVPAAGDSFNVVANDEVAKEAVAYRIKKYREKELAGERKATLEDLLARMSQADSSMKELPLIIKADTQGSVEAIKATVLKLSTEKVRTKIVHAAVGGITETDIMLAKAANAVVVGFNVRPDRVAAQVSEQEGVDVRFFSIIYELVESVEGAMAGRLSPIRTEKTQGRAEVRNLFSVPKIGTIAGTSVLDGKITRNGFIRVVRDSVVVYSGKVGSLKRFKEDAKEVLQGFECGVGVENFNDLKVGDVLESYIIEETAATLN